MPLVGAAGAVSTGTSGATVTPAFGAGASRTVNNLLVLQVASTGSATLPAAISGWSIAKQQAGTLCSASIYYKVATGSDAAPTVPVVASAIHNAQLYEFSGLAMASPLDQTAGVAGVSTPLVATAGAVDALAGELVIGCGSVLNSSARVNTLSHTINNATDTETTNGATSIASHYDFTYGFTTAKVSADSDSFAFATTQLTGVAVALASFKLVAANTAYDTVVDADSPISHWKMGATMACPDRKGVRSMTTVGGGPVSSVAGLAADGTTANLFVHASSQRFGVADSTGISTPYTSTAWSLEAWASVAIIPGSAANPEYIYFWGTSGLELSYCGTSGNFRFLVWFPVSAGGGVVLPFTSIPVVGERWHLVVTYDGATLRGYANGVLELQSSQPTYFAQSDIGVNIGNSSSGNFGFDGTIDEVAWYNTALSLSRVQAHYVAGGGAVVFTDSGLGAVTASGSGVEDYQSSAGTVFTDTGSGMATASGSGTEGWSDADAASGAVTAGGTSAETAAYADARSGTVTASGAGIDSWGLGYLDATAGTITASGTGTESAAHSASSSGTVTAGGTGLESAAASDIGAGTVTASGTGVESHAQTYTDTATGTITATGTGVESYTPGGAGYTDTGAGTVTTTGTAVESSSHAGATTGAATVTGAGTESAQHSSAATGTASVTGTGVEIYAPPVVYVDATVGTIVSVGSGVEASSHDQSAAGLVTLTGFGVEGYAPPVVYWDIAAGVATVTGAGLENYVVEGDRAPVPVVRVLAALPLRVRVETPLGPLVGVSGAMLMVRVVPASRMLVRVTPGQPLRIGVELIRSSALV